MANSPGSSPLTTGTSTSGKQQMIGSAPQSTSSGRSGRSLNLGLRLLITDGTVKTSLTTGQIFPRGLD